MRIDLRLKLLQLRALRHKLLPISLVDQRAKIRDHLIKSAVQIAEFVLGRVRDRLLQIAVLDAADAVGLYLAGPDGVCPPVATTLSVAPVTTTYNVSPVPVTAVLLDVKKTLSDGAPVDWSMLITAIELCPRLDT